MQRRLVDHVICTLQDVSDTFLFSVPSFQAACFACYLHHKVSYYIRSSNTSTVTIQK